METGLAIPPDTEWASWDPIAQEKKKIPDCWKCGRPSIKEAGSNVMVCMCKAITCSFCHKSVGYDLADQDWHYYDKGGVPEGPKMCPMFMDEEEVPQGNCNASGNSCAQHKDREDVRWTETRTPEISGTQGKRYPGFVSKGFHPVDLINATKLFADELVTTRNNVATLEVPREPEGPVCHLTDRTGLSVLRKGILKKGDPFQCSHKFPVWSPDRSRAQWCLRGCGTKGARP